MSLRAAVIPLLGRCLEVATLGKARRFPKAGRMMVSAQMGIGNLLLFVPLLQSLRAGYPDARIALVFTDKNGADALLGGFPGLVDEVIHLEVRGKGKWTRLKQAWKLGRRGWDMAVFRFNGFKMDFMLAAAFGLVGIRVGHCTSPDWINPMDSILNRRVPMKPESHEVDRYLEIAAALGLAVKSRTPSMNLPGELLRRSLELLQRRLPGGGGFVVLVPGTSPAQVWKRWPDQRWTELLALLRGRGLKAVFLGSKSEAAQIDGIMCGAKSGPECVSLAGECSLMESVAILKGAEAVVAADTALMHLAGAVGVLVVGLFGPTDDARTGPLAVRKVLLRSSACKGGCFNLMNPKAAFICDPRGCMNDIQPARVIEALNLHGKN